jgi:hypothetical protein
VGTIVSEENTASIFRVEVRKVRKVAGYGRSMGRLKKTWKMSFWLFSVT